ncbi:hypothetical protein [Caulobacter sp. 1776]|uniref:hypothetical protein n=1 Tax=Caulobacter sp. 1776 TaxID=3156420 RepID=UPI003398FD00
MSDLIDRYLAAVAALLPKASRQDIIAELRDLIMNRVEEQEAKLGRPLDKRETEALLRDVGHPIAVAGRYGPRQSLIGPEIYPFWLFGVKVLLAIAALATVVPAAVLLVTGQGSPHTITGLVSDFIQTALSLIGCATLIGAAIERGWIKVGEMSQWKASDLPQIPSGRKLFVKNRFEAVFELVMTVVFILWWTGLVHFPLDGIVQVGRHGDRTVLIISKVFQTLHLPILLLAVMQAVSALIMIIKPAWVRGRAAAEIVCSLGGLALSAALWAALPLFLLIPDAGDAPDLEALQRTLDMTFQIILVVTVAINATKVIVEGRRLVAGR